jgi:hypothetical protein
MDRIRPERFVRREEGVILHAGWVRSGRRLS